MGRHCLLVRVALLAGTLAIAVVAVLSGSERICRAGSPAGSPVVATAEEQSRALRAAGATAFNEGAFEQAVALLGEAARLNPTQADPELHYLRGEALYTLGREFDAGNEHLITEREVGPSPTERLPRLWLARVYARRDELGRADIAYERLWPAAPAVDVEVAISQVESHLLRDDWLGGRQVLSRLLTRDPLNVRGRELLAFALEASGDLQAELPLRSALASEHPSASSWAAWGRALERASDFPAARDRYQNAVAAARGQGDPTVTSALARTRYRTTPELGGSVVARRDPQADALRLQAGAALPFGPRHVLSLVGWREMSSGKVLRAGALVDGGGVSTGARAAVAFGARTGASLLLAADLRQTSSAPSDPGAAQVDRWRAGAASELALPFLGHAELQLRGELNQPWNDAAVTVSEGGSVNSASGSVYAYPTSRRLLFTLGAQWRQLQLTPGATPEDPRSTQWSVGGGADLILWRNPAHMLRGEALDERMTSRLSFSDAAFVSYRHQQMWGESTPDFLSRIVLGPRANVHLGSVTARKVFAAQRAGVELRGAFGYDSARTATIYSAGAATSVALSWSTKLLVNFDLTQETAMGFTGTRQTGWVTFHADL